MVWAESFVFTEEPPVQGVNPDGYSITARSGIFLVSGYPQRLLFGAYIELAFDEGEYGSFRVQADVEIASEEHATTAHEWEIDIPQADDGWSIPRYRVLPLTIDFVAHADVEVVVSLWRDDNVFLAQRRFAVCECAAPDYPPES